MAQAPVPARPSAPTKGATIPGQQQPAAGPTKEEFRKLPPTALLTVEGKQMTKQAFIDEMRKKFATQQTGASTKFTDLLNVKTSAARAKFVAEQQAILERSHKQVFAEAARITQLHEALTTSPGFQAIQKESQALIAEYKNASPAEKTRIEARASELHKQLQQQILAIR
ncbi:MAG: hypothetical protein M3Z54_10775 [Gemmatimonadota bacterium]|nr:hypothetical protein [Gemmatimonadota bacterium]